MIVVAGESLVDLIIAPDGTVTAVPGGGPFNTARTVARLGASCSFLGCLSTDRFGRRLRESLVESQVDDSYGTVDRCADDARPGLARRRRRGVLPVLRRRHVGRRTQRR